MTLFETAGQLAIADSWGDGIPLAVGGLPSPESIFTIHCVAEILRRTRGQSKILVLNTEENIEKLSEATIEEPIVPFFDIPDQSARDFLIFSQMRIVVVTGNFIETARFCMAARDLDELQAARFVSQSFSCLEPFRQKGNVRWVNVDRATSLTTWIDEVAAWLGLQPSHWHLARQQILSDYATWPTVEAAVHGLVPQSRLASAPWEDLPVSALELFEMLEKSYHAETIDSVFWPADCILEPGTASSPVTGAIALTGPARILTLGPFLHVPPGRWTARYQFQVDEHPVGNLIEFDAVHGGNILASGRILVDSAGKFGFDCKFNIGEPRLPLEIRAILIEGSIGGVFEPIGISLNHDA